MRRSRRGVLGGRWEFLTGDMDDRVIPDVIPDVLLPRGRYSESFVLISHLEVCQEGGGVMKAGTLRMLRIPDRTYGGYNRSRHHELCFLTPRKIL